VRIEGHDLCGWFGHRWIACAWSEVKAKVGGEESRPTEWECFRCRARHRP
jgi:hypothetical protein